MKYQRKTKPACWTEAFPDQVRPRLVAARKTIVRKRIRQVSVKQASRNQRYARIRNEFMSQPENKVCCLDGCANWSEDVHHSRGRIGDLLFDTRFFLAVCREHHAWIDANRDRARTMLAMKGTNRRLPLLCQPGRFNTPIL